MSNAPPRAAGAIIALLCLIWGSTWIVILVGLRDLPPLHALAGRFTVAAIVMIPLARWLHEREGGVRPNATQVVLHGWFSCAWPLAIVYVCEQVLPSGLTSLIWGIYPLLVAGLAPLLLPSERLTRTQWVGFLGAFAGLCLLFATDLRAIGGDAFAMAALLLLSPLVSATGTLLLKRTAHGTSSVLLNRDGLCLAAVTAWIAAFLFERDREVRWTAEAIASVLYMGLCATVLAFSLYFWLLRTVRANQLAMISYVTPLIALTLGYVFRDERLSWQTAAGAALILSGIVAGRRR